jgi:hypothetical protein
MPNWCFNCITITGEKNTIATLTRVIEDPQQNDEIGIFESLIGREPEIDEREYNKGGWYDSNIGWFGTKWDVSYNNCVFQFSEDFIIISVSTAWSPPISFGVRLHEMYGVNVELQYEEPGDDFCGKTTIENGEVISEDFSFLEGKYRLDSEGFWCEVENVIEYSLDEEKTVDEFMSGFHFVDEEDYNEIKTNYENSLTEKIEQ